MPRINSKSARDAQTNAAAAASLGDAGPDRRWRAHQVSATVSAGAATLTITTDDGTSEVVIWEEDVTPAQPARLNFSPLGLCAERPDTIMRARLTNPGAGNTGRVSINAALDQ